MTEKNKEATSKTRKTRINCYPGPRGRGGWSSRPSTKSIPVVIPPPLNSIWVFSLPMAMILASSKTQIAQNQHIQPHAASAAALREKWKTTPALAAKTIEPKFSMKGFAIGWKLDTNWWNKASRTMSIKVCNSPEVTAGVLARIESGLLLVDANPVHSIDKILDGPFAFSNQVLKDDSLFIDLKEAQIDYRMLS